LEAKIALNYQLITNKFSEIINYESVLNDINYSHQIRKTLLDLKEALTNRDCDYFYNLTTKIELHVNESNLSLLNANLLTMHALCSFIEAFRNSSIRFPINSDDIPIITNCITAQEC